MSELYDKIAAAYMAIVVIRSKNSRMYHSQINKHISSENQPKIYASLLMEYTNKRTITCYLNHFPESFKEFITSFLFKENIRQFISELKAMCHTQYNHIYDHHKYIDILAGEIF